MIKFTPQQIEQFPVVHLSFSAIRCYMSDRQLFFKRYIRKEFEDFSSPSMLEGKAYHRALEALWSIQGGYASTDEQWNHANNIAHQTIVELSESSGVDFGKTGSVEKSLKIVSQALEFYRADCPTYNPIAIEKKVTAECWDLDGELLPIPLKVVYDLVSVNEAKEVEIIDHKLVSVYHSVEEGSAAFELQAGASFFTAWHHFGAQPKRMIFDQVKKSKNSDGSPQRKPYIIEFFDTAGRPHPCLARFIEVYRRVVMELAGLPLIDENGAMRFIPNPFDMLGGEESWKDFCNELFSPVFSLEDVKARKAMDIEPLNLD